MRPTARERLRRHTTPVDSEPPPDPLAPERALLAAVLDRAIKDAQTRAKTAQHYRDEAHAWLRSPLAQQWCEALNVRYTAVAAWLAQQEA